ncbi:hypothetical protein CEXT_549441 [Caerostris extrusa]|uniref:Transmembrane protein n=1 Tax=Caerostris extrusa TaxID=172846 RepID=A0AAV4XT13_CAEEX|nr:hypothetical protein CEXT_549441 [Caerostris extrusa]
MLTGPKRNDGSQQREEKEHGPSLLLTDGWMRDKKIRQDEYDFFAPMLCGTYLILYCIFFYYLVVFFCFDSDHGNRSVWWGKVMGVPRIPAVH